VGFIGRHVLLTVGPDEEYAGNDFGSMARVRGACVVGPKYLAATDLFDCREHRFLPRIQLSEWVTVAAAFVAPSTARCAAENARSVLGSETDAALVYMGAAGNAVSDDVGAGEPRELGRSAPPG
jgi:hypothetical protein